MNETLPGNASILLLDSDPLTRTVLCERLEKSGYLVVTSPDVGAAVDRLKEMRPDLLIVRPQISSMPGHMAAEYLRTRCPGLPVLIVGGYMDDERVRVQDAIKDFHVFPKPFAAEDLLACVRDVLRTVFAKKH